MTGAGAPFFSPANKPLASLLKALPLSTYQFFLTTTFTQALVYRDDYLKLPYNGHPQADEAGNFAPIYLDPKTVYRIRLIDVSGATVYPFVDNYVVPCPSTGTGPINVNPITGEVQINPPDDGGSDNTLTVTANNTYAAVCLGNPSYPDAPLLQFINTLAVGKQTANFAVTANKPGIISPFPTQWLPILGDGGITYYLPMWS